MKFETRIERLGIDENEVKSIIANCFCGEINGAYFIDLSAMRKCEIQEMIGNHLDAHKYGADFCGENKRMSTFCKAFDIEESQIRESYVEAFNEWGYDIAYELESNKDVVLVLTDDARYENSFVSYAPSQTGEIELLNEKPSWETEEVIESDDMHPVIAELKRFFDGEDNTESQAKMDCSIVIRKKWAKCECNYTDIQKFTEDEIAFLTGRNTGDNIIQKLEIIRDAEIGKLGEMTENEKRWDAIGRFCNKSFIEKLINELTKIKEENGKIVISKDFDYKFEIDVREDSHISTTTEEETSEESEDEEIFCDGKVYFKVTYGLDNVSGYVKIPKQEYSFSDNDFEIWIVTQEGYVQDCDCHEHFNEYIERFIWKKEGFLDIICDYAHTKTIEECSYVDEETGEFVDEMYLQIDGQIGGFQWDVTEEEDNSSSETIESEESWVNFEIVSAKDSRIYLRGEWDYSDYDEDCNDGDWQYEQNDGLMQSHIPSYWKIDGENLSFEYDQFIGSIDWGWFRQTIWNCRNENRTFVRGDIILHINEGAKMECEIEEPADCGDFIVEIIPKFNGKTINLVQYITATNEMFNPYNENPAEIEDGHIYFEISKDYFEGEINKNVDLINEEARRIFAKALTYELGIYAQYGETIEQSVDDYYDDDWLFKLTQIKNDDELKEFLINEGIIEL